MNARKIVKKEVQNVKEGKAGLFRKVFKVKSNRPYVTSNLLDEIKNVYTLGINN